MAYKFLPEQQEVIDAPESCIKVRAGAGTGKTTTLTGYAAARPTKRILYLAFNKAIQEEAGRRFGRNTTCRTVHSMAYQAIGKQYVEKLDGSVRTIEASKKLDLTYIEAYQVINTLTQWLLSDDPVIERKHAKQANVVPFFRDAMVKHAEILWDMMVDLDSDIPMTHDGYLKLYQLKGLHQEDFSRYDIVLMDEAQDTNPVTNRMLEEFKGTKVYVGDQNQSIYAFRGAINAMSKIDAAEYRISSSFRFGPQVADVANVFLKYTLNDDMRLRGLGADSIINPQYDSMGQQAIIGRTNTFLINKAIDAMESGQRFHVVGGTDSLKLSVLLDAYRLFCDKRDFIFSPYILQFEDYQSLRDFAKDTEDPESLWLCKTVERFTRRVPDIVKKIKENNCKKMADADLILCTAHKSKGLEFEDATLGDDFKDLYSDEGIDIQEGNLIYVAVTRAKKYLRMNESLSRFIKHPFINPALTKKEAVA